MSEVGRAARRHRSNRADQPGMSHHPRAAKSFGDLPVDIGIATGLFAIPFLMGGRQALGQLVLVIAASWTATAWMLFRQPATKGRWHWTGAEMLFLAAVALVILQITPLSAETLHWLSPGVAKVLPYWTGDAAAELNLGHWTQLSLSPAATKSALSTFLAYGLLFVITVQRIRSVEDIERLLRWICISVTAMAIFGIVQLVAGNGKFFWVYTHPYTDTNGFTKGSFTNRNHFAQFLALGVGPLIWWIVSTFRSREGDLQAGFSRQRNRSGVGAPVAGLLILALGTVLFSGLLSLSRGGAIAMCAAMGVSLMILYFRGYVSGKMLGGLFGLGALVVSFLLIYGYDVVAKRMENWESPPRFLIWQANLDVISEFPIFGTGTGSHREAHQMYLANPLPDREFTHAESSYIQTASENGVAGLLLAVMGVLLCCYWCIRGLLMSRSPRTTMIFAAIAASFVAHLLQATVDFTWYAPALVIMVLTLAACACRLYQIIRRQRAVSEGREAESPTESTGFLGPVVRPMAWVFSLAGLVLLSPWMVQSKLPALRAEPYWHDYLRLTLDKNEDAEAETAIDRTKGKLVALAKASEADPDDARIQLRMAMGYISLFHILQRNSENMMTLAQFRDAAIASPFESQEQRDEWLSTAIGKNRKYLDKALQHTRRSLRLCPIQGKGYVCLAELGFLEGVGQEQVEACIKQALAVNPYDGQVLFAAGREAWVAGNYDVAIKYWRESFHRDEVFEGRIVDLLLGTVPADFLIENFDPEWLSLMRLRNRYHDYGTPEDYAVILKNFAEKSVARAADLPADEAIDSYLYAQRAYDELKDVEHALQCLQAALSYGQNTYRTRYAVGVWLYEHRRFAEAAEHLAWCSQLKPEDESLRQIAEVATKEKLRSANARPVSQKPWEQTRTQ